MEHASKGVGLYVKSVHVFSARCDGIFSLNAMLFKLFDLFIYLGSNITFTGSDVNIRLDKTYVVY